MTRQAQTAFLDGLAAGDFGSHPERKTPHGKREVEKVLQGDVFANLLVSNPLYSLEIIKCLPSPEAMCLWREERITRILIIANLR